MINHELTDLLIIKNTCCLAKVDYIKFKCASDASMDDNVNLIKGIFYYFHLDWKTHKKSFKLQQLRFLWRTPKS